jgi:hypothetical protein
MSTHAAHYRQIYVARRSDISCGLQNPIRDEYSWLMKICSIRDQFNRHDIRTAAHHNEDYRI